MGERESEREGGEKESCKQCTIVARLSISCDLSCGILFHLSIIILNPKQKNKNKPGKIFVYLIFVNC